jgi:hypothetical protein
VGSLLSMTLKVAMYQSFLLPVALLFAGQDEKPFPLRRDAPPKEWTADTINEGLPYRWEKGTLHLLAWEVIEDRSDSASSQMTQVLVLKWFDKPTEKGGHRWVLAQVYHFPKDHERPWRRDMLHIPPLRLGEKMADLTDAQVFGHEFYQDLPTDKQIEAFLRESRWPPRLGPHKAFTLAEGKVVTINYVTTLVAGGVDRALWKKLFERDVPTALFPELKKGGEAKE